MSAGSVTSKGQITIPVAIRKALGIGERDRVDISLEGDRAVITKAPSPDSLRGAVKIERRLRGADWKKVEAVAAGRRGRRGGRPS